MADLEQFRADTRQWLKKNAPAEMFTPPKSQDEVCWGGRKAAYPAPVMTLARRHGRARLDRADVAEASTAAAGSRSRRRRSSPRRWRSCSLRPPLIGFGLSMIGPLLLQEGSEELKKEHLPPIVRGEIRWCQGYSEPGSGSDLASLQTKAVRDGDVFVLNGQKVWTSYADKADWMFILVRTDFEAPKHNGITFLLMDMTSPGVIGEADQADQRLRRRSARRSSPTCACR